MKKKNIIIVSLVAIGVLSIFSYKSIWGKEDIMSQWGRILSSESKNASTAYDNNDSSFKLSTKGLYSENTIKAADIYEAGADILISKQEFEQTKAFYTLQGKNEADSEEAAIKYIEEFNALYVEAINNGYDVTTSEIDDYIAELKTMAKEAVNSNEINNVISQFDSEEDYWRYEKLVYQKQLPIQKYVSALEKEYTNKTSNDINNPESTDLWNRELESIKAAAVKKQNYKKVESANDINLAFMIS